mmetsp:Transcript_71098/g.189744  ORF Transcript_71098/g.189744 Transcript_71098/m.189744 type:complete len:101 (-) Transcript_71098:286-588(-)
MPEEMAKKHGLAPKNIDPATTRVLNDFLENLPKVPTEKYGGPMTTQQEVGWYATTHARHFQGRKNFGIKENDITKYAEAYTITVGRSPFHRRPAITTAPP